MERLPRTEGSHHWEPLHQLRRELRAIFNPCKHLFTSARNYSSRHAGHVALIIRRSKTQLTTVPCRMELSEHVRSCVRWFGSAPMGNLSAWRNILIPGVIWWAHVSLCPLAKRVGSSNIFYFFSSSFQIFNRIRNMLINQFAAQWRRMTANISALRNKGPFVVISIWWGRMVSL